ncbi:ACP S-malonyltransferase [Pelagibacterium lentulum]|uniref:Malonyl CoA-acyl carrier protein transacylase n=1 Tax=Pelagibacterium lentulum TaxID=2029865 RepID=A0A916REM7_9HYPH|nr:ACP S-malonyltransferase [Pelagibacterium lentulum]GGA50350.1 malonyl CoA-acyl carrier protein transacylase [Pelagibacterium lentulum]
MSKPAFTFPGQGSQAVGMGRDLADAYPQARAVFEEVDDALGVSLSSIMFEGPEDTLRLTENAQPALMATSMAVVRVLEANGINVAEAASYVAGHSLGEYSALCAAGTFSLSDASRLLQIRGRAMQQAVPVGQGAMAAILGLEFDDVVAIAKQAEQGEVCGVANDNAPGQVVVSGHAAAVERAIDLAKVKGAKRALALPVSAPFHCALMAPAAEAMQAALSEVEMKAPVVPLVSNVLAAPISDPDEIRKRLIEQVTGMVRWTESVSWLTGEGGVSELYELGTGKVLTGLARRINKDAAASAIGTPDDIVALLAR